MSGEGKSVSRLSELADRVAADSGPDRSLDVAIFREIGAPVPFQFANAMVALTYDEADRCYYAPMGEMRVRYEPPVYTASVDTALTLLPETDAAAATFWKVGNDGEGGDPSLFKATILVATALTSRSFSAVADTAPLAITAAALRARSAS